MDKNWIESRDWCSKSYLDGVESFLRFALSNQSTQLSQIKCPCRKCVNRVYLSVQVVKEHLEIHSFERSYKKWIYHGEPFSGSSGDTNVAVDDDILIDPESYSNMVAMLREGNGVLQRGKNIENENVDDDSETFVGDDSPATGGFNGLNDLPNYYKLLVDAETELYDDCPNGVTKLSFVVELLQLKQLHGWTNRSFTALLQFLMKIFPKAKIPKSFYYANKLTTDLGF